MSDIKNLNVKNTQFKTSALGYDKNEVAAFFTSLQHKINEAVSDYEEKIKNCEGQIQSLKSKVTDAFPSSNSVSAINTANEEKIKRLETEIKNLKTKIEEKPSVIASTSDVSYEEADAIIESAKVYAKQVVSKTNAYKDSVLAQFNDAKTKLNAATDIVNKNFDQVCGIFTKTMQETESVSALVGEISDFDLDFLNKISAKHVEAKQEIKKETVAPSFEEEPEAASPEIMNQFVFAESFNEPIEVKERGEIISPSSEENANDEDILSIMSEFKEVTNEGINIVNIHTNDVEIPEKNDNADTKEKSELDLIAAEFSFSQDNRFDDMSTEPMHDDLFIQPTNDLSDFGDLLEFSSIIETPEINHVKSEPESKPVVQPAQNIEDDFDLSDFLISTPIVENQNLDLGSSISQNSDKGEDLNEDLSDLLINSSTSEEDISSMLEDFYNEGDDIIVPEKSEDELLDVIVPQKAPDKIRMDTIQSGDDLWKMNMGKIDTEDDDMTSDGEIGMDLFI